MWKLFKKIRNLYWKYWSYDYRPGELLYQFKCWAWYRYRTVKPKTLKGNGWVDRDFLFVHCSFQILDDFIQKELKGYKPEDWAYYYTDRGDDLVEFGGAKKDPYFVLNWINEWFKLVYLNKEDKNYDKWHEFCAQHTTKEDGPGGLFFNKNWDCEENEMKGKKILNRSWKKEVALDNLLTENLILLVQLRKYMWT